MVDASLTPEEREIIELTAVVWNKFLALPVLRQHDASELARDIHAIQLRVMSRVAVRTHPDMFNHDVSSPV